MLAISLFSGFSSLTPVWLRSHCLEAQASPIDAFLEHEGKDAHSNEVRAMNALEALRNHSPHAEQARPLGGPVAARSGAIFAPGEVTSGSPSAL